MNEHLAFVPTSFGPIGIVVAMPDAPPRAAAFLLQGIGPVRFGVHESLTRLSRVLANDGVAVLRMDYPGRGDSIQAAGDPERPMPAIKEVLEWFRDRVGRRDVVLLGRCFGGRLAARLAASDPDIGGLGMLVPYPWTLGGGALRRRFRRLVVTRTGLVRLDRRFVAEVRTAVARAPVWIVVGDRDRHAGAIQEVARRAGGAGAGVRLEVVADAALYDRAGEASEDAAWERLSAAVRTMVPVPADR